MKQPAPNKKSRRTLSSSSPMTMPMAPLLLLLLLLLAAVVHPARADLTYYLYLETEDQTTGSHRESSVVVLRSIGSLPLEKSSPLPPLPEENDGREGCPESVATDGGINPNFLCAGSPDLGAFSSSSSSKLYPLAGAFRNPTTLPVRFSAFSRSRGTPSGILVRKNALVVPLASVDDDGRIVLDGVSMGPDTSKDAANSDWLLETTPDDVENEVIAEWYLLTEEGGDPIRDGGLIRFVRGKPPVDDDDDDEEDLAAAAVSLTSRPAPTEAAAVSLTSRPAPTEAPVVPHIINHCETLTEILCSDSNNDRFGTFCSLLMQVGLDTVLDANGGNRFTVFVPTNEAFEKAFADRPQPALLAGHDLTRLLLTHVVATGIGTDTDQSQIVGVGRSVVGATAGGGDDKGIRYEEMICGSKQEMASDQVAKIGCDETGEVAYLIGPGNSGYRPRLVEVDRPACNGILHALDFVVLPKSSSRTRPQQDFFGSNVDPDFVDPDVSTFPDAGSTNSLLSRTDILDFFAATVQDFAEEDEEALLAKEQQQEQESNVNDEATEEPVAAALVGGAPPGAGGNKDDDEDNETEIDTEGAPAPREPTLHLVRDWVIPERIGTPFPSRTVRVGDSIVFSWEDDRGRETHDVWIHPSGTCDATGAVLVGTTRDNPSPPYVFTEEDAGTTVTFSCDIGAHCRAGMILDAIVLPPEAEDAEEQNDTNAMSEEVVVDDESDAAAGTGVVQSRGFHSFFERPGVANDLAVIHGNNNPSSVGYRARTRPGNNLRGRI